MLTATEIEKTTAKCFRKKKAVKVGAAINKVQLEVLNPIISKLKIIAKKDQMKNWNKAVLMNLKRHMWGFND